MGNVLATISDKKKGYDTTGDGQVDYFLADTRQATDYHPFGWGMIGRSGTYNLFGYKYGFNGQEKSTEIEPGGSSMTAEFWQYDARLGRRWNADPKSNPYTSVYSAFNNNPLMYIDIKGDTPIIEINSIQYSKDFRKVKTDISTSLTIKVLNISKDPGANTYVRELVNYKGINFNGTGEADIYGFFKHDGKRFPKEENGAAQKIIFSGNLSISANFTEIHSLKEIQSGDNVLVVVDGLTSSSYSGHKKLNGLHAGKGITFVDFASKYRTQTIVHETFHEFGLMDIYKKNVDGSFTPVDPSNLMDMFNGFEVNRIQTGEMISNFIQERGQRTNKVPLTKTREETREETRRLIQAHTDIDVTTLMHLDK